MSNCVKAGMKTLITTILVLMVTVLQAGDHSKASIDSLYKAGERAYNNGNYAMACKYFDEVLKKDENHLNAYLQRGFCFTLRKEYEKAVADFSAVIKRNPEHLWAYTSRGSAYNKLGQYNLAMTDFDKVLSLDPHNSEAYNNRGWSKKFLGDQRAACKDWKSSARSGNSEAKIIMKNNHCR